MKLTAIAAMSKNRVIGNKNQLPWDHPEDLKFFFDTTKKSILIMGRKTFESLGKPLPGRFHFVITRNATEYSKMISGPQVEVVPSYEIAVARAAALLKEKPGAYQDEVYVSGGGEIYANTIRTWDRLLLTVIDEVHEGDAFFPEIPNGIFKLNSERLSGVLRFQDYRKI